ncbi:MAG: putative ABC exporter domain-containing protein, partial [Planctomycetaceae bacterium]
RRDLLLYRIVQVTLGLAALALWLSLTLMRFGSSGLAVYAGVFLGLLMLSLLQMLVGLLASTASATLYGKVKWLALGGVAAALLAGGWLAWPQATTAAEWLREVTTFGPVQFVLFPFRLISETIAARRLFPDLLLWGGGLLLFDLWLIQAILTLDADFLERSVTASERMYERLKRMQRGQGLVGGKMRSRVRPPLPPFLLGAGPIAWRQAVLVLRSVSAWIVLAGMLLVSLALPLALKWLMVRPETLIGPIVSLSVFLLPQLLQFDFRSDLDRMEILKSLPVTGAAVVLGQLAVPVGLGVAQWWLLALACAVVQVGSPMILWGLASMALPVNLYLFAVENLFCLLFPFRVATGGAGDLHAAGRNMMLAAGKLLTSMLGLALSAGLGGLIWWLTRRELLAVLVGAAGGLLLVSLLLIVGCVLAYDRLDAGRAASE